MVSPHSHFLFDLEHSQVPIDEILPAMLHRDMIPVMEKAVILDGAALTPEAVADERNKLLVSSDRVIGVTINGESRAYPISVLNVHEIINDTLGGEPIAVTYHWPSDGAMVFDRRIDGRTATFGVSGLLYNANMLLYAKNEPAPAQQGNGEGATGDDGTPPAGGESLYCQLLARAITGTDAQAGIQLRIIPSQVASWGWWIKAHPDSTVAGRDPQLSSKRYKQGDPGEYQISDEVKFAPRQMPPEDSWAPKTRVVVVQIDDARRVYPLPLIHKWIDENDTYVDSLANAPLTFRYDHTSQTVDVTSDENRTMTIYHAYWFSWHAMHPEDELADDA